MKKGAQKSFILQRIYGWKILKIFIYKNPINFLNLINFGIMILNFLMCTIAIYKKIFTDMLLNNILLCKLFLIKIQLLCTKHAFVLS